MKYSTFLEYIRLIRLPGLGGFSIAPVFGAISLIDIGVYVNLKILIILFLLGVFKSIYGFVLNDYVDIEVDRLSKHSNKRPLVTGTVSKRAALFICILCIIAIFALVFIFFYKNQLSFYLAILCIIIAAIFGTIYNMYGKKFTTSPFISALADALFVLVGAYLVASDENLSIFTWVIFILVFTQYLFMTAIVGGLKDAGHDYKANVKNIALLSGVRVDKKNEVFIPMNFKTFGMGIRLLSSFVMFVPFIFFEAQFEIWEMLLIIILVIIVLYLTLKLLNIKKLKNKGKSLKLAILQGLLRYSFVPVLLIPVIGLFYAFLLIIFPVIWTLIFRFLLQKDYFAA